MLSPLLIIGVGGAGGKTIRAMKQELNRILESSGYTDGIPAAWQFLQIDTTRDGIDFPAPMLPQDEFHCVVPNGAGYADLLASITGRGNLSEQQIMLSGWGVPVSPIAINCGAGQNRAIGRVVLAGDSHNTYQAIRRSISKMLSPTAMAELASAAHSLGFRGPENLPQAFIISSLGGGTGSGMFMDVAELLKRATSENWAQNTTAFLYAPEVFRSLGPSGRSIPMNALGAMNELIAGQWMGISERTETIYRKFGVVSQGIHGKKQIGSSTNILLRTTSTWSTKNPNTMNSDTMDDLLFKFGIEFSDAISTDRVGEFLEDHISDSYLKTPSIVDDSGLAPESFTANYSSQCPFWANPSLTEPILEAVAMSKNQGQTWEQFWDSRRARPLTECIPFENEMRRSIITGWFVATLFGMRKVRPLPEGRTVQIWNPTLETPDWSSFPSPLLPTHREDSRHESWVLPQLLMSAGIALANFGKSGNPEFLNGYRLLKFLGREVTTSFRNRDNWDGRGRGDMLPSGKPAKSNYLQSWVESGESPYQNGALVTPLQVSLTLTPDRAEALIKNVQLISTEYKNFWSEMSSRAWHDLPETWELKEDIDLALEDISNYVSRLRP
jgi:hypothetical protein